MLCRVWHYIMVKPGEMSNFFLNVLHKITPNTGGGSCAGFQSISCIGRLGRRKFSNVFLIIHEFYVLLTLTLRNKWTDGWNVFEVWV